MRFKMALIQMEVVGGDKQMNLARAQKMIAEAASNRSQLAVLPEAFWIWAGLTRQA